MDDFDHRSLGIQQDLFHIQDDAPGMVFWRPRGYAAYLALEAYIRRRLRHLGYAEVKTPQLLPRELWRRSGHLEKFGANMFCVDAGEREMALKPMSCPCHVQIFNSRPRSWRDLPIRYAEFGACHRNEASGALLGLMRTRAFEQDDAHLFCRPDQVQSEVARFIGLLSEVYRDLGFETFDVALSTRPELRAGSDAQWDWAEDQLAEAARQNGLAFRLQPGEGAFYGPKLEFILNDRHGRAWQCGTIQLDNVLPERLGAAYIAPDGSSVRPVMIHHAVFGSMGRILAVLLEHHAGALPYGLAPDQVAVLPITQDQAAYADAVLARLEDAGVRAALSGDGETLSRRIVAARANGVPVIAVLGAQEAMSETMTLRERDGAQRRVGLDEAVAELAKRW